MRREGASRAARIGLDYATFGNHEFDLRKTDFDKRMAESTFVWFSSNVTGEDGQAFPKVPANVVLTARDGAGRQTRIGMFGLTIDSNAAAYVRYLDPFETARRQVADLTATSDVIVALTHLAINQDEALAESVPASRWCSAGTSTRTSTCTAATTSCAC